MRRAAYTFVLFGVAAMAAAQQTEHGGIVTFRTSTQLVVETVVVTDKSGRPVEGLTARDFIITENGVPQTISVFENQVLPDAPATAAAPQPEPGNITIFDKLGRTQIAPESESGRYKDRRLMVLYFDMTAMQQADQLRALAAAKNFIRTQMQQADMLAIMRYSGGSLDILQDFTGDRDRLLSIIETLIVGEGQGWGESTSDAGSADTGAAFGQDDSEFNIFNTDRQLSALQTAATMLGRLREKKLLIYFAGGLRLNGLNNQAQLRATINAATRAGVSFWPIDARGLVAQAPLGDATRGSPGGIGMYTGGSALAVTTNFQQSQDTLYALASDTGGKALLDDNDLARGIARAAQSVSSYYIIGYYTSNQALDGKFRRVKISLREGTPAASLDYRQGYYAGKEFSKFTAADKERQLEDALMLGDPITELTIAMEVNYFQLNRAEYFVPVTVKIPGRELALVKRGGGERTLIDFIGEIKDEYGTTITNVRDKIDLKLSGATASELAKRPVEYDTGFTLLPGKYTIKFLARDAETGRIGTYQTTFVIPNLNKEDKRVPISSVVLSSQRMDLKDALYNAIKDKSQKEEPSNPLVRDGQKLIPSVTRVFRKGREMDVYLQAYEPGAERVRPLVAYLSIYQAGGKALETQPIRLTEAWDNRLRTMPIQFHVALDPLAPGDYICQVTVLDPGGRKAAFWQAPVVIVP
ncbi:MAG: VWA domain-containing protein [Acidobacteria bacterium]|nr:VWA domain-containing protein [Acidobacteriota bacterium]